MFKLKIRKAPDPQNRPAPRLDRGAGLFCQNPKKLKLFQSSLFGQSPEKYYSFSRAAGLGQPKGGARGCAGQT